MTNERKKFLIAALGIIALAALIWWRSEAGRGIDQSKKEPIKIGVVASFTGPGAFYGGNIRKGVDLAVEEINGSGGVNGQLLEVLFQDDQTNPRQTIAAAQKLITVDGVTALIGAQWDFLANAVIPLVAQNRVVLVSPGAPFDSMLPDNQVSPYFFTTFPSAGANQASVEKFFSREDITSAVVVAANNDWGSAHVRMYEAAAQQSGVRLLEVFRLAQTDNNDLRTEFGRIKQLNPQAILLVVNEADNINFAQRYQELGLTSKVITHENFANPLKTGRLEYSRAQGFYILAFSEPQPEFVEAFHASYNEAPQIAADTSYDAVYALKEAIEKGGPTRDGVAIGMKKITSLRGATGTIDYSEHNYSTAKHSVLIQVKDNQFETIN